MGSAKVSTCLTFSYYDIAINIHPSALKHGVEAQGVIYVATHFLIAYDIEEGNPSRQLRLGFDPSGTLLEIVVLTFDNERELVIHAMKARKSYLKLLP